MAFAGYENHGAAGMSSRQGMVIDDKGAYVRRAAPLPGQFVPEMTAPVIGTVYPKMLFAKGYWEAQQTWRETVLDGAGGMKDALAAKAIQDRALQTMRQLSVVVSSQDEEEEAMLDGFRSNPADHLAEAHLPDPRVPVGAELRRSLTQQRESLEDEVLALRRQLALKMSQLHGGKALDMALDTVIAQTPEPVVEPTPTRQASKPRGSRPKAKAPDVTVEV